MTDRLYFLKVQKDFMRDHTIKLMRSYPGGSDYVLCYMSLMLESLETNGILEYKGLKASLADELEIIVDFKKEVINFVLSFMEKAGYIEALEDGGIEMLKVKEMTQSETKAAERKRLQRKRERLALEVGNEEEKEEKKEDKRKAEIKLEQDFEECWKLYPKKKGKSAISKTRKRKLFKEYGKDQIKRAIERYKAEIERKKIKEQYVLYGSTFFNTRIEDYLDNGDYVEEKQLKPTAIKRDRSWQELNQVITMNYLIKDGRINKKDLIDNDFTTNEIALVKSNYREIYVE